MKKLAILFGLALSFNVFADVQDGVTALSDDATEAQIQLVRDGAKNRCEEVDDEDQREICVVDYYAQHNLEEAPSCD
ncbi:hypothetical protein BHECKSOX2_44 [Bathymodiolus heckerae thiotrophic gill symbiont]|uniref:hypothetical protein n=1 Tax=Bathymodiolus heckerae thiotrophic gill symbiont TaxID=1052212 RepID=UPI0010BBF6AB|nr:hypothetical protein [Bathymodiolus heckerae thiotrophic gill symbiont]SMN13071.1 hypothetical protein BHECKSOX2_44 [Bathymodiolus heckerae thiotrophic gill symbiont]SMN16360.1 hypothetical protein CRYPD_1006 [uncultured Candidatus Thioglobus sp.]